MSRELKFRGWYTGYKGKKMSPEMMYDNKPGDCLRWKNDGREIEIMQYTGLHDKNGKEIYEGDIVNHGYEIWVIKWYVKYARFVPTIGNYGCVALWNSTWAESCEVIGNICENPELLEAAEAAKT